MASFLVPSGQIRTTPVNMAGVDDLTIQFSGALQVASGVAAVLFAAPTNGAFIGNSGTIGALGSLTAGIDFFDNLGPTLTAAINNGGQITAQFDAIRLSAASVNAGTVTILNSGNITGSAGDVGSGNAIDFGTATGSFLLSVTNSGSIFGINAAAIVIGANGNVTNNLNIAGGFSGNYFAEGYAIQYVANATGTVTNNGTLQGDSHAIFGSAGSAINVINNGGAAINGFNGAGVFSLGSANILNYNTISGLSNASATDLYGPGGVPDGIADGDTAGVDVAGQVSVDNYGGINGFAASGHAADNLANVAEGIRAGGGDITNRTDATIFGQDIGIFIGTGRTGDSQFLTSIQNSGTIFSNTSFGIQIIGNFADSITNFGTITGGGATAILFGAGDNTLFIGNGSVINGLSDGGGGINTLDYSQLGLGGGATVNLLAGTATGTGGIANFRNVIGSDDADVLVGDNEANLLAGGSENDTLDGGNGDDTLEGGAGADILDAGDGTDKLYGGAGDDTLLASFDNGPGEVHDGGDDIDTLVIAGTPVDFVQFAVNLALGNDQYGNIYVDIENVVGGVLGDTLTGDGEANRLEGRGGIDILNGGIGNDTLDGGIGADTMSGGADNDTYVVDDTGDVADESVGGSGGTDTVTTTVTVSLLDAAHFKGDIENITLLGGANLNATGNNLANVLIGNSGNNTLNGNGGADTMQGLAGNDTYVVDDTGDVADESIAGSGGIDTVTTTVTVSLLDAAHFKGTIENVTLLGAANLNATGNNLANVLIGNSGNNTLNGNGGADTMQGGAGNDLYGVHDTTDVVDESVAGSGGTDTVNSVLTVNLTDAAHFKGNIENVTLLGATNINATGNNLANVLIGNSGNTR